jgi:hypothetical protein
MDIESIFYIILILLNLIYLLIYVFYYSVDSTESKKSALPGSIRFTSLIAIIPFLLYIIGEICADDKPKVIPTLVLFPIALSCIINFVLNGIGFAAKESDDVFDNVSIINQIYYHSSIIIFLVSILVLCRYLLIKCIEYKHNTVVPI